MIVDTAAVQMQTDIFCPSSVTLLHTAIKLQLRHMTGDGRRGFVFSATCIFVNIMERLQPSSWKIQNRSATVTRQRN